MHPNLNPKPLGEVGIATLLFRFPFVGEYLTCHGFGKGSDNPTVNSSRVCPCVAVEAGMVRPRTGLGVQGLVL